MKETGCSRQKSDKRMEQLESGGMVEKRVRLGYVQDARNPNADTSDINQHQNKTCCTRFLTVAFVGSV